MTTQQILDTYGDLINSAAQANGIDPNEIAATIQTESSGNPNAFRAEAKYPPGSYGLMQLLYVTAQGLGYSGAPEGLYDPQTNINLGALLLAQLHARFGDDPAAIYSAYNSGSPTSYQSNQQVGSNVQRFLDNLASVAGQAASETAQAIEENPGTAAGGGLVIAALVALFLLNRR